MDLLKEGAAALGLDLPPAALAQFRFYLTQLMLWNRRVSLTGLKGEGDMVVKHFLDSLAVLPFLGAPASLADLGSGPGFPGLALKLARPELQLTLVEAREKKAAFLEYLIACLKLPEARVARLHLTPAAAREWGARFQVVVSRATFTLSHFLELAAPLLLPGGLALALKGPRLPDGELQAAANLGQLLGLAPLKRLPYRLPITGEPRLVVLTHKNPPSSLSH